MKLALVAAILNVGTAAQAVTYDIAWTGSGGYSMTGQLEFSDALLGTGAIDETQITDLSIEVFLNGGSLGSRGLLADGIGSYPGDFNLNFDTSSEQFIVGGVSSSSSGQVWFASSAASACDSVGFGSGSGFQAVCVGSVASSSFLSTASSTLTATRVTAPVPLPATGVLLAGALGFAGLRRRKSARA